MFQYLFQNTKTTKFHEITFSKYFSFDSRGDVLNPNLAQKIVQNRISYTNGHRKIKINSKRNFEVRYSIMELFSRNLEILAPCLMSSSQNWVKKIQSCIPCRTGGKNIKNRNYNNFGSKIYFCRKNFKRLSKFVKPVLRSQFICLKVSINSYFDPFIAICTWCNNKDQICGWWRHNEEV